MGWSVQIPRRRGGKALWSAGRQWPAVSPRYGGRVCAPAQIQVEPRTVLFALSLSLAQGVFLSRKEGIL